MEEGLTIGEPMSAEEFSQMQFKELTGMDAGKKTEEATVAETETVEEEVGEKPDVSKEEQTVEQTGDNTTDTPPKEEEGSVEKDVFEGLELETSEEESPIDFGALSNRIGKEIGSWEDFDAHFTAMKESQVTFANENIQKLFQEANEIAQNGGDYTRVFDAEKELKEVTSQLDWLGKLDKNIEAASNASAEEDQKTWLNYYYQKIKGLSANQAASFIQQLEDSGGLGFKMVESTMDARQWLASQKNEYANKKTQVEQQRQNAVLESRKQREAYLQVVDESIRKYTDPDGERFTKVVQQTAKRAFNNKPVTVTLDSGVAAKLLGYDGKKVNLGQIIQNLGLVTTANIKKDYLLKKAQSAVFDNIRVVEGKKPNSGTTSPISTAPKSSTTIINKRETSDQKINRMFKNRK